MFSVSGVSGGVPGYVKREEAGIQRDGVSKTGTEDQ